MIQKINEIILEQNNGLINTENIFIIDYKNINGGDVEVLENKPEHNCQEDADSVTVLAGKQIF